jgi:hypothetical protein
MTSRALGATSLDGTKYLPVQQRLSHLAVCPSVPHLSPSSRSSPADLAGHERYLKTTLYGLTSGAPSCVMLMIGANAGLIGMAKEHLAVALALNVPIVVCITKVRKT